MINETDRAVRALNSLENDLRRYRHQLQKAMVAAIQNDEMREFNIIAAEVKGIDYAILLIIEHRQRITEEK